MKKKCDHHFSILTFLLIGIFLLLSFGLENSLADVEPEPNQSGGILTKEMYETYLRDVNVTMTIYDDKAICKGIFLLQNPSEESENISLYFDPGTKPENAKVTINGTSLSVTEETVDDFYDDWSYRDIASFDIVIKNNSSLILEIEWEMWIRQEYSHTWFPLLIKFNYEEWCVEYLIIGTRSWSRNIENVNIKFDVRTDHLDNCMIRMTKGNRYEDVEPDKTYQNIDGLNVYEFTYQDFSDPELTLLLIKKESEQSYTCTIIVWGGFILICIIILAIIMKKKYRKKKKDTKSIK